MQESDQVFIVVLITSNSVQQSWVIIPGKRVKLWLGLRYVDEGRWGGAIIFSEV